MTARPPKSNDSRSVLESMLKRSRSRWRTRGVLEGAAKALLVVCVATAVAVVIMDRSRFDADVVAATRTGLLVIGAGAAVLLLALPGFSRLGNNALAR